MKIVRAIPLFLLLISFISCNIAANDKIRFFRPVIKGELYRCEVKTEFSETVEVSDGTRQQIPQLSYFKVELAGNMKIIKASESTYPDEAEISIDAFLFTDGKTSNARLKQGSVIGINFTGKKPEFTLLDKKLPPLTDDEKYALSIIFTSPKNKTMSDMLGREKELSVGSKWNVSKIPFITEFRKNGFTVAPEELSAEAFLMKKLKVLDIDCWDIVLSVELKDRPDIKFTYKSEIFLPVNEAFSGTVIYNRETFTSVKKKLPDSNPLSTGLIMQLKTAEKTYSVSAKIK